MDQQLMPRFEIELPILQEVVNYLVRQPYQEVAAMIAKLNQLKELPPAKQDPRPSRPKHDPETGE